MWPELRLCITQSDLKYLPHLMRARIQCQRRNIIRLKGTKDVLGQRNSFHLEKSNAPLEFGPWKWTHSEVALQNQSNNIIYTPLPWLLGWRNPMIRFAMNSRSKHTDYLSVTQLLKALAIIRAASSMASTFWLLNFASMSACASACEHIKLVIHDQDTHIKSQVPQTFQDRK